MVDYLKEYLAGSATLVVHSPTLQVMAHSGAEGLSNMLTLFVLAALDPPPTAFGGS